MPWAMRASKTGATNQLDARHCPDARVTPDQPKEKSELPEAV
jgi:hypothetical protein